MNCPCDKHPFPPRLTIAPQLASLPRQIATFPEFRSALLHAVPGIEVLLDGRTLHPFAGWRAQLDGDLGLMLLEMIAYTCDTVSFYDEVIADECYIRTARLPASLRRLVARLGYVAHPPTGSSVHLTAFADGRLPVKLHRGTAFRSGAFGANPPQVFELDADTTIHPLNNQWGIAPTRGTTISGSTDTLLVDARTTNVAANDVLLVSGCSPDNQIVTVLGVTPKTGIAGDTFKQVTLDQPVSFANATPLASVRLSKPTRRASLWADASVTTSDFTASPGQLPLDRVNHAIKIGDQILISQQLAGSPVEYRRFSVSDIGDSTVNLPAIPARNVTPAGSTTPIALGPFTPTVQVTFLHLDRQVDAADGSSPAPGDTWAGTHPAAYTVHYGLKTAGHLSRDVDPQISPATSCTLLGPVPVPFPPGPSPSMFSLSDVNTQAVEVTGSVDYPSKVLSVDSSSQWTAPLSLPVSAFGNMLATSRGQSVMNEVIGSGDASQSNQSFALTKSPLTYFPSPSASTPHGFSSTLQVFVAGVLWSEVPNFFVAGATDEVYIVRQDDAGKSTVMFGDGINGARPTTGAKIMANYRYGAGAADPPALSVRQLAKPVAGLRGVRNPLSAFGGSDADPPNMVRTLAPRSALLLGRSVSIDDMQVVAAQTPGVVAASAQWAWNQDQQRPLVQVWYIGDGSLGATVKSRLRALSDPTVPFAVDAATAVPVALALQVQIDARRRNADLEAAIFHLLIGTDTGDAGVLLPRNLGIGATIFLSWLFEQILAATGAVAVTGLLWNGAAPGDYGVNPGDGGYFDFTSTPVSVTCSGGL